MGARGHIVHVILKAVEQIPTAHFQVNHRGSGSEQYPPTMLLALLIYSYATSRFGSRTIEAASYSDAAGELPVREPSPRPRHDLRVSHRERSGLQSGVRHRGGVARPTIPVDSGFYSETAVQAVECKPDGTPSGVTVLVAVEKLSLKTLADLLPQLSTLA